jgi:RNA methyltransferase, TrmH family
MLTKEILSLQHPIVKHLVQLRQNKAYRDEQQSLLITGINAIQELAETGTFKRVLIENGFSAPFSFQSQETLFVSRSILEKITALENPEPLVVEIDRPSSSPLFLKKRVLLLDRISDPGNLGTLLRTALAFGWDGVFLLEGSVDLFNDKVLRASKGAIFQLSFDRGDETALQQLLDSQSWALLSAQAGGQDVKQLDPIILSTQPLMLAVGNESHGLSDFVSHRFTPFALPMKGQTDSLNAAVAGSIFLYLLQE